ncbi:MAG: nuclear transport factor 2 family protein [Pseudomonadota bacterium]
MRLLLILMFFLVPFSAGAEEIKSGDENDRAAISRVIQDYFDGIGAADEERLNRAFAADKAAMVGVVKHRDGEKELMAFPDMKKVIANWAGNPEPEGVARDGAIMNMDIVDGRIAMVMFRYKDEYYDVLTLVKLNDEWKIATKTFVQR